MNYLSQETGLQFELIVPETYKGLMDSFADKKIDLAWFGGVSFVKSHYKYKARPLVMRDIDPHFSSYYLANSRHSSKNISDFKHKRFSFGSKLSTSGHIMPRYFMQEMGISPDAFFAEVRYSGKHDQTAFWVRDEEVDLGVANSKIIDKMFAEGTLSKKDVRIIGQTPEYPDYVWALQSSVPDSVQIKIRDAFLNLTPDREEHGKILAWLDANHFLPAHVREFSKIEEVLNQLDMLE
jgi:phosphonate transport system substrate-binding protein